MRGNGWLCYLGAVALAGGALAAHADELPETVDFNRDIRPILNRHCLSCHGADEAHRESGLRLDEARSAMAPADSGLAAIVPGQPDESELIARVDTDDDAIRMPPVDVGDRLSDEQIAMLRRWIEQGAAYAGHWAFTPPIRPEIPPVQDASWPSTPIDAFILQRLESEGLRPNPPADRWLLLRRVSLDLRGLPPSLEEIDAFAADPQPGAYERMVDRFLADPAYGERWAAVWLDLARYADSAGYGSDPLRLNAWRYRDWLIDALNRNLPYDQFTHLQMAGDLLPDATWEHRMATAFHRNTMTNTEGGTDDEEFRVEAVKDRVDTTMQVWMGLTAGCAKCHNHKYDPISQREYYQLVAVFNQTKDADRPDESPAIEAPRPEDLAALARHEQQLTDLRQQLAAAQRAAAELPDSSAAAPVTGRFVRLSLPGPARFLSLAEVQVFRGVTNLARDGQATQSSTGFEGGASRAIDGNTDGDYFAAQSTSHTSQQADPWWEVDLGAAQPLDRIVIWNRTDNGHQERLRGLQVEVRDSEQKTVWQAQIDTPPRDSHTLTCRPLSEHEQRVVDLERQIAQVSQQRPVVPTLPVLEELPPAQRRETYVLDLGNFLNRRERVEPGVPAALHPLAGQDDVNRLALARWLTDPANPLTARVQVNRLWARLFGTGLVATEEDFGTQGDPPTHAELLDYLATEYIQRQWDTKSLLRLIVTSAVYRQSAAVRPEHTSLDPTNRLLSRGPRARLEGEMVRDQALALSGLLSRQIGGPSVFPYQPPGLWRAAFNGERTWAESVSPDRYRRGLYTFWRRTVPYPSLATWDVPSREICVSRRVRTNTPLQALVTLNDPTYIEAAQALGRRIMREGGDSLSDRAAFALRLCLCRPPTDPQIDIVRELVTAQQSEYAAAPEAARQLASDPLGPPPPDWDAAELAAWTVAANVLLNMDAVLNK